MPVRTKIIQRVFSPMLLLGCLLTSANAQQKSARVYYEEAKQAGALPSLPYVCFRTSTEASFAPGRELPYNDPTFAMVGTSQQIADFIKKKSPAQTSTAAWKRLMDANWLYVDGFDHGIDGGAHMFTLKDPTNPSRADWGYEGTVDSDNKPLTWDFNINWGTLRFRESITVGSDTLTSCTLTYYGQCEGVSR
jgi:hypothetical protein